MSDSAPRAGNGSRPDGGHRAANRIVDILESVAASRDGLALRELSAQMRAPKSSLLPLLRALAARAYLLQERTGEYRLGPGALELTARPPAHRELANAARPALAALMRRTGETVYLGALTADRASVVFIDKFESEQIIRDAAGVGDRLPLHATSSGKTLLAFLPAPDREAILRSLRLRRYTPRTVTSLPALRASLEDIRRAGVCVSVDEIARGASGIAAPILDRHGRVVATCGIGGPTDRVRPRRRLLAADVRQTARDISSRLGHAGDGERDTGPRSRNGTRPAETLGSA